MVDRDPTEDIRKEREPVRGRLLTAEEQNDLIEACESWFRPVVVAALYTGARRADLLGTGKRRDGQPLTWSDVDLRSRVITFKNTKEKKVRRVPIRDELLWVLRWLPSKETGQVVFVDDKGKPITPERASERLRAAAKKAELSESERLRFHDLRHTCATDLLNAGTPVHVVKEWLGHARLETTDKYAHANLDDLQRHAQQLDGHNLATNRKRADASRFHSVR